MKSPNIFLLSSVVVPALLLPAAFADTLKQPAPFAASNVGDLYAGTGTRNLASPGFFAADFQPFPSGLGSLLSFSVGCKINGKLAGVAGMEQATGMAGCALGGTFTIGGVAFSGTGGGGTGEAAAGEPLDVSFGIPDFETSMTAANAGVTYNPEILTKLTGTSPVQLAFSTGVMINFTNVDRMGANVDGTLTLTYTYQPAQGGPPATYSVTRLMREPGNGDVTLAWDSTPEAAYTVDATDNLSDWTVIVPSVPGAGAETTHTETGIPTGTARRFYRVRRL